MEARRSAALVISLDLELHWGVRDHVRPGDPYWRNLAGERDAIARTLRVFAERDVAATWATVGFLFARDENELHEAKPSVRPRYAASALDPYKEPVGADETEDAFHYGASLLDAIRRTPRQEIGSHTFSHYYCQEAGADVASFEADLESAKRIAAARGVSLRSLVFPRNQHDEDMLAVVRKQGFECYRGAQRGWMYDTTPARRNRPMLRAARAIDSYAPVRSPSVIRWHELARPDGLVDVRGTHFVRMDAPRGPRAILQRRALRAAFRRAARENALVHLWWHPHNMGRDPAGSERYLREIINDFDAFRRGAGMRSLSMVDVAEEASLG